MLLLYLQRERENSAEVLNYSYNAMGALSSLSGTNTYVSQIHYAASGQVTDQIAGNGLLEQSCYNANTLRLSALRVYSGTLQDCLATPSSPRLNLSYSYFANGNIQQMIDATRSETLNYTYDELDRLDTVSGAYSQNHDYNLIGNITTKDTTTYTYGSTAHKHAVTSLSTGETYTYDANGNMTQRVEGGLTYTQTFDAENRLKSVVVSGLTTQFLYDGDGNLVKKTNPNVTKTVYVSGVYEVDKTSANVVTRTVTYYPVAGAMRISGTMYYTLKDHLGSASVVTDATGIIVGENRYYAYGETRFTSGTIFTDKLFTGQQNVGLGIYRYGARFYSPKLGRFLSADSIVPGAANPQNLNRFSYVRNNPLRYTDPTGHGACNTKAECEDMGTTPNGNNYDTVILPSGGGGGGGNGGGGNHHNNDVPDNDGIILPLIPGECPLGQTCIIQTPPASYCGGGPNGLYNILDCGANITQDIALVIDIPFAITELGLIGLGCLGGPEGCVAGAGAGIAFFNVTGANAIETALSIISAGLSVAADASANGITHIGESSATAIAAVVAGTLSPDPVLDLIIDGYGSGYNHDVFNGVYSIFNSEPVIR